MASTTTRIGAAGNSDRIELLQTFVHIVEAGSLSAAAARMGATQPTVSRRLQALERHLGLRLLRRSTHAMKLTEDGERCFERARELIASWEAFDTDLRGAGDEPEGLLRVVAPHAFGQQLLLGPVSDYLRNHARVSVEWLLHDRRPDFIAEGIDCAIEVGEVDDPSVVALKLSEVPRIVVAAPSVQNGRPLLTEASMLADWPWLALRMYYRSEILLTHASQGTACRLPLRPRLVTDSLYALRSAALLGLGVCVGSSWIFADDLAQGRLVRLLPEWRAAPLPMYLVYPRARFYPAKLQRFTDMMRVAVPAAVAAV